MRKKLITIILIILVLGLGILTLVIIEPAPEPLLCSGQPCNVILIIPEALSARHMGIYGYERDTTPFIDEFFSEESLIFENAWSGGTYTFASFAVLFTSQLAADVYLETWTDMLSDIIPTFINVLEKNNFPKLLAHTWTLVVQENDSFTRRFKSDEVFQGEDQFLFLKAAEWIEEQTQRDEQKPFFLFLQPFAPHDPYDPPEPYRYFFDAPSEYSGPAGDELIRKVESAIRDGKDVESELNRIRLQYDQEIRYLDSMFESFVSQIPEEVVQNTIFIFTSDHGEAFGQHGKLRHGGTPYEEEIHVPFLIRAPGIESRRIQEPITHLDVGPTILDIFGFRSPRIFQGISLSPLLRGEELPLEDRIVRVEWVSPVLDLSPEEWDAMEIEIKIREEEFPHPREYAVRKKQWKLLQLSDGRLELYNLERDYYEQNNLIPQWPDLSEEEKAEALPLFEALGERPSFIYEE